MVETGCIGGCSKALVEPGPLYDKLVPALVCNIPETQKSFVLEQSRLCQNILSVILLIDSNARSLTWLPSGCEALA